MNLPEELIRLLSAMLSEAVGMEAVEGRLDLPLSDGGDLLPPPGARVWLGHHAVVLCVPVPMDEKWRPLASVGARWIGDVLDAWWKCGRILDGYLVVVFPTDPSESELGGKIAQWEETTHICRRQAIWPDGGGHWGAVVNQLTLAPLPQLAGRVGKAESPNVPSEILQMLDQKSIKASVDLIEEMARQEESLNVEN